MKWPLPSPQLWGLTIGLLLLLGCSDTSFSTDDESAQQNKRAVVVKTAGEWKRSQDRSFAGTAQANIQSRLSFRIDGNIDALPVHTGQTVKRGTLLAELDDSDYQVQRRRRRAELEQARAGLEQARSGYNRTRALYASGSSSAKALEDAQAELDTAQAQVQAARQALELAKNKVSYCRMEAPIDGEVVRVPAEVHQNVSAGQPIVLLAGSDPLEIHLGVPESFLGSLQTGDPAEVTFDAQPKTRYAATVTEIGVQSGPTTAFPVTVQLEQEAFAIRSGMAARVIFHVPVEKPYIKVPPQAVQGQEKTPTIFVYQPDTGQVEQREVQTGSLVQDGVQIFSGITPGERFVVRGVNRLRDGMSVQPLSE